jgi:5-methylcytosine-specific restriction endonuclease McrA
MLDGSFDGSSAHAGTAECGFGVDVDACNWRQAHAALQKIARKRAVLDVEEAHWLVIAKRARVHVELGFATLLEYMERILGYGRRVAFERLRVAEKLEELPETRELLAAGAITYSAVRELTRVAEPDTEHAWLDEVNGKTIREIEDRLSGVAPGDAPDDPRDPMIDKRRWSAEVDADVYAAILEARRVIEEEHGGALDDNAFVAALCERALRAAVPAPSKPPYQVALTICERCNRGTQDAGGRVIDVAPTVVERARCDAEYVGHVDAHRPEPVTTEIPAAIRRLVMRRDHHRCRVPGCGASKWLEVHHIVPRGAGSTHDPSNLVVLCGAHHRAHHDGKLRIIGTAESLRFERHDGSRYGDDFFAQAKSGLRNLGWKPAIADAAVERVRAHAGTAEQVQDVIAAALRECPMR